MRSIVIALLLGGCGGEDPASSQAAPATQLQPSADLPESDVPRHMDEHFFRITAAREALIRGDLGKARAGLKWLAEEEPVSGLPQGWRTHVERMKAAARSGAYGMDRSSIGRGIAAVGHTCGECHAAHDVELVFADSEPPEGDAGLQSARVRHAFAAEEMWRGLIGPEQGAWVRAVGALEEAPLDQAPEAKVMSAEVRTLVERMQQAGTGTLTATSPDQRIKLYGDFLAACASCHIATGGGPEAVGSEP